MIDVFICTYNPNLEYLKSTIDAILGQELSQDEWSLTIIDNNSAVPVSEAVFVKEHNIKTVVEKQQGLTAARRCATELATRDLLIFVDDDNILNPKYLSTAKALFADKQIGILSGNISPEYELQPEAWFKPFEPMLAIREYDSQEELIINTSNHFSMYFPIGAGMVIRKDLIKDYYNNHLTADNYIDGRKGNDLTSSEDVDLDLFALNSKYKIGISPLLKIKHIIPRGRIQRDYIVKLAKGNLKSGMAINKKWSPIFKHNIFDFFDSSRLKLTVAMFVYKLLSYKPSYFIRYEILKEQLKYKKEYNI